LVEKSEKSEKVEKVGKSGTSKNEITTNLTKTK
jgi:hypothetical protein